MVVTRVITVETTMACCRDGQEAYRPLPKPIRAELTEDYFETSLVIWRDRADTILYNKYNAIAESECAGMGTLKLCYFNLSVINVDEFGEPTKPRFIEEEEEMLDEDERLREELGEEEPPIELYSFRAGKVRKKLRKQIAKELAERERRIAERTGKPTRPIIKELAKGREEEYYEQAEREKVELSKEAEQSEVPEVVIQQLQILENRMARTDDANEYESLRKEYNMLKQSYGLEEEE